MEEEYEVLTFLQENEITTQRKISSRTGLSLGAVNLLLKKMIRKGLIKVEKINTRSMRYILTPRGLQEKARLTYLFIRSSYRRIIKINHALDDLLDSYAASIDGRKVILFGPKDEVSEIICRHLDHQAVSYRHYADQADQSDQLKEENLASLKSPLVITWREEEEEKLNPEINSVNIMKIL